MLYGSCNDSEWWLAFIMHNLYTKLRILGVVTDYHHVHTYIHITMGSKTNMKSHKYPMMLQLNEYETDPYFLQLSKTWQQIVCLLLYFSPFLPEFTCFALKIVPNIKKKFGAKPVIQGKIGKTQKINKQLIFMFRFN